MFPKQAANSLVTETLQYFVFFCRSVYYAIFAKCLIINVLRLIRTILFFIAFLNITYCSRHTFATLQLEHGTDIYTVKDMLGHTNVRTTQIYGHIVDPSKRKAAEAIYIDGLNSLSITDKS